MFPVSSSSDRRRKASRLPALGLPALTAAALGLAIAVGWGQAGTAVAGAAEAEAIGPGREVILLLDTSAEAGPDGLEATRAAAVATLAELGEQDLFNVIAFGARPAALYPASWPATAGSLDKARRFVADLEPGGERSLLAAAQAALAPPAEGYGPARVASEEGALPRRVLLVTSRPLEDAELLAPIRRRLPATTRLDLIPAIPASAELARFALGEPVAPATDARAADEAGAVQAAEEAPAAAQSTPAAVATGLAGTAPALLLVAVALLLFLGVLVWTVRRGLATDPASG